MSKLNFAITAIDEEVKEDIINSFETWQQGVVAAVLNSGLTSARDLFDDSPFDVSKCSLRLLETRNFSAYKECLKKLGEVSTNFCDSPFFEKDEIIDEFHEVIIKYSLPYLQALVDDVVEVAESSAFAEYYDQSYSFEDYAREVGDPIMNDRFYISQQQARLS